jgi:hypothetical protein
MVHPASTQEARVSYHVSFRPRMVVILDLKLKTIVKKG